MKKVTITKRFYIGSKDMSNTYFKNGDVPGNMMLLGDAVDQAVNMVETGQAECVFVVEVVKVIRKQKQPVVVEDVRK